MTSREATSLLPRAGETPPGGGHERSARDWAAVLAFGAIGWPWLLRSLSGGRPEDKAKLLERLGLPGNALPYLGAWKADVGLLSLVTDHILAKKPRSVVEFGTGASTLIVAQALKVAGVKGSFLSFEQHSDFVDSTRGWLAEHGLEADLRAVPLAPSPGGWPGLWYQHGPLPERIDFLLVDGPPWVIHPFTRGAADSLFERIPSGGTVMLDDGARPGERVIARRWRKKWPQFEFELVKSGTKGTLVGVRK